MNDELRHQLPPDDQAMSDILQSSAQSIHINPVFQSNLEVKLKQAHPANKKPEHGWRIKLVPAIGWAILIVGAVLLLNWAVRSLAPNQQPAAGKTAFPSISSEQVPAPNPVGFATPTPRNNEGYEWHGTTLYLAAPLPEGPVAANVYQLRPEQPASIETARALALRFGIDGNIYQAPGELPDTTQFLVTDGKQRLYVRSDRYFTYYADFTNYSVSMFSAHEPLGQAEALASIDEFLMEHGFDFAYQVENAPQIINHYYVVPLSPDRLPLRYDYLMPVRMEIKLDASGQVIFVYAGLIDYEPVGTFGIRTAQDAWQKVLDDDVSGGIQESMRSSGVLEEYYWQHTYPENQRVTIYGRILTFPPAEVGETPLVSIGDYTATGNVTGLEALEASTLIQASGQFFTENGVRKFNVESWEISFGEETSLSGTLQREGEQVVLLAHDGNRYPLADVPPDAPFGEPSAQGQLNVSGIFTDELFEWWAIQYFPADSLHGGGGGGGGSGFYKLNLTGTPVPFPTPDIAPEAFSSPETYVVQEGDTLVTIAEAYDITVDELIQANGLAEATIFIGQTLVIPGAQVEQSPVGQQIEGQRGIVMVNIYRKPDGSQRTEYSFISSQANQYNYLLLTGENLKELEKYHNRPVDIWGTIESVDSAGAVTVEVDRYEIPYPDLTFQIVQGTQALIDIQGQSVVTITTADGKTYAQFTAYGDPDPYGMVGNTGNQVLVEALAIPDETFGGYPVLRIFGISMAVNPKNGQAQEMQVTADQPYVIDEPQTPENYTAPTATIEKVELVYYITDPRYIIPSPNGGPRYLQPVWRFYGHYSHGDEFEILVQALRDEFLLPEVETIEPPG